VRIDDAACPFCGAIQRRTGAPLWAAASLVCALGLVDVACEEAALPMDRGLFASSTGTDAEATSSEATGTTSMPTTTGSGGSSSSGGTGTGSETGSGTVGGTTGVDASESGASVGTGEFTSSGASTEYAGESAAYGSSPGDWPGMEPTGGSMGGSSGSSGSSGSPGGPAMAPGDSLEDGCGCSTRARPGFVAFGLLALLMRRRSRSRRGSK
jgi:hypothetical protein